MPNASVTVDLVIFTIREGTLQALLIRRGLPPFRGRWALPGGFVRANETLEAAARRELEEETGLRDVYLEQLYTFGDPGRDPRGRTVTVAYYALIRSAPVRAATDAADVGWFPAARPPALAFDHAAILAAGLRRLRAKLEYTTAGFQLLPEKFTLTELQRLYEIILGKRLDKRNFRKKVLSLGLLQSEPEKRAAGPHRPARLYSFRLKKMMVLEGQIV
jgi:8-oxo-dGTP diphosphatase